MSEWFTADIFMVLLTLPELQNEIVCNCWNTFFWLSRMIMTRDPGFPIQGNTSTLQAIKSALRIPAAGTMAQANLYNFNIWGPARCHQHSTKAGKVKPAFPSHRMPFQSLHTESHQGIEAWKPSTDCQWKQWEGFQSSRRSRRGLATTKTWWENSKICMMNHNE